MKYAYDEVSLRPAALAETIQRITAALDTAAKLAVEHDDEPDDEPSWEEDIIVQGEPRHIQHIGSLRRPVRAYLAQRAAGADMLRAVAGTFDHHAEHPTDPQVTAQRARFDAAAHAVLDLLQLVPDGPETKLLHDAMEQTQCVITTIERAGAVINAFQDAVTASVAKTGGHGVSLTASTDATLQQLGKTLVQCVTLRGELANVARHRAPDLLNLVRDAGGRRSAMTVGRLVTTLSEGFVGGRYHPAFTVEEQLELVVDDRGEASDRDHHRRARNSYRAVIEGLWSRRPALRPRRRR